MYFVGFKYCLTLYIFIEISTHFSYNYEKVKTPKQYSIPIKDQKHVVYLHKNIKYSIFIIIVYLWYNERSENLTNPFLKQLSFLDN